jgi:uncharacterized membrane protein
MRSAFWIFMIAIIVLNSVVFCALAGLVPQHRDARGAEAAASSPARTGVR